MDKLSKDKFKVYDIFNVPLYFSSFYVIKHLRFLCIITKLLFILLFQLIPIIY